MLSELRNGGATIFLAVGNINAPVLDERVDEQNVYSDDELYRGSSSSSSSGDDGSSFSSGGSTYTGGWASKPRSNSSTSTSSAPAFGGKSQRLDGRGAGTGTTATSNATEDEDEDAQLARAIAASLEDHGEFSSGPEVFMSKKQMTPAEEMRAKRLAAFEKKGS